MEKTPKCYVRQKCASASHGDNSGASFFVQDYNTNTANIKNTPDQDGYHFEHFYNTSHRKVCCGLPT